MLFSPLLSLWAVLIAEVSVKARLLDVVRR
jgi:hypothetical protein